MGKASHVFKKKKQEQIYLHCILNCLLLYKFSRINNKFENRCLRNKSNILKVKIRT